MGKFVLFTFLQQEQVQGFLHFLLAFHRKEVFALGGVLGQTGGSLFLTLPEALYLGVERHHQVVDGGDDGAAHRFQRLVKVYHQRVLLATVRHQVVTLQLHVVVFGDLALDVAALDTGIGRKKLVTAGSSCQVVADIPCHGELGVQCQYLGVGLAALSHVKAGSRLHVG